jgi:hypothetical protein
VSQPMPLTSGIDSRLLRVLTAMCRRVLEAPPDQPSSTTCRSDPPQRPVDSGDRADAAEH